MAGTHRTPGTPSPSSTQRRVAWWGPVVLLVCLAVWTMGSLPGLPGAAAGVRAPSPPPAGRTVGAALPGAAGQAPILSRQLPMTGQVGPVLTGTAPGTAPAAAVARCRSEVLAGEAVARAGAASYRDWSRHVQVQLDLDAGRTTWLEAVGAWSATRAAGAGDAVGFARAVRLRAATGHACAALAATATGPLRGAAGGCVTRSGALDRLAAAATPVMAAWSRHLAVTTTEAAHAPGGPQASSWPVTVRSALPVLAAYRAAWAAAAATPRCGV